MAYKNTVPVLEQIYKYCTNKMTNYIKITQITQHSNNRNKIEKITNQFHFHKKSKS